MGEDFSTHVRQFAEHFGTEFKCPFGSCGHANFRSIDEMIGHLCTTEAAGGHESVMHDLHNCLFGAGGLNVQVEEMGEDFPTFVRRFAGNSGTEFVCRFGNCDHETFRTIDEMIGHLLRHIFEMYHLNNRLFRAQPATSCISRESIEQTKEVSSDPVSIQGGNNLLHSSAHKDCKASYAEKGEALEMERTLNVPAANERLVEYVPTTGEKSPSADCKILPQQWTDTCAASFASTDLMSSHSQMEPFVLRNFQGRDPVYWYAVCHLQLAMA